MLSAAYRDDVHLQQLDALAPLAPWVETPDHLDSAMCPCGNDCCTAGFSPSDRLGNVAADATWTGYYVCRDCLLVYDARRPMLPGPARWVREYAVREQIAAGSGQPAEALS